MLFKKIYKWGDKMKVKLNNKKFLKTCGKIISWVGVVLSLLLAFVDFSQEARAKIVIVSGVMILLAGLVLLFVANKAKGKKLTINGTAVEIKYGDIFKEAGLKVIAFNEFFDTQVDNIVISELSLNGKLVKAYEGGADALDSIIEEDSRIKGEVVERGVTRPLGGKHIRYKLGSICKAGDYLLLALTKFDKENKANLSVEEYIMCLLHMWQGIDAIYAGMNVTIPLLGGGITRFRGGDVPPEELLKYMIDSFKMSRVSLASSAKLTIVLNESLSDKICLYDIGE